MLLSSQPNLPWNVYSRKISIYLFLNNVRFFLLGYKANAENLYDAIIKKNNKITHNPATRWGETVNIMLFFSSLYISYKVDTILNISFYFIFPHVPNFFPEISFLKTT